MKYYFQRQRPKTANLGQNQPMVVPSLGFCKVHVDEVIEVDEKDLEKFQRESARHFKPVSEADAKKTKVKRSNKSAPAGVTKSKRNVNPGELTLDDI